MHFLHPLLLTGAAAAALPWVAHLLSPKSRQRVRFSAVAFLPQSPVAAWGRRQLGHRLLLGARMLLLALLALLLAHPVLLSPRQGSAAPSLATSTIIVIDASASMNYTLGPKTLLQAARALAHEWVTERMEGGEVGLLIAGAPLGPAQPLTADGALLHEAIETLTPTTGARSVDLGAAIVQAASMLPSAAGSIVVISDLSQNSLPTGLPSGAEAPLPPITWLDAASRQVPQDSPRHALPNVAITALTALPGPSIAVEVHNFGDGAVSARGLTLQVGHHPGQRALLDVPAHGTLRKVFAVEGSTDGVLQARARLDSSPLDGFVADDVLSAALEVAPPSRVLAVDGAPHSLLTATELYYVERALAEVPKGQPPIHVTGVPRSALLQALGTDGQAPFDVLLLANVGALTAEEQRALARASAQGVGLIIALGDQVVLQGDRDAVAYSTVMPFELRDLARHPKSLQVDAGLGFGAMAQDHPLLQNLGEAALSGLRRARTQQFIYAAPHAITGSRVLLAFDDGAPALLEAPRTDARGPVLLWTTSLDRDWTDLPTLGVFVPLLQRLVRYAAAPGAAAALSDPRRPVTADTTESDFTPVAAATLSAMEEGQLEGALQGHQGTHGGQPWPQAVVGVSLLVWLVAAVEAWLCAMTPRGRSLGAQARQSA